MYIHDKKLRTDTLRFSRYCQNISLVAESEQTIAKIELRNIATHLFELSLYHFLPSIQKHLFGFCFSIY
jgi:hypothetical protein